MSLSHGAEGFCRDWCGTHNKREIYGLGCLGEMKLTLQLQNMLLEHALTL